MPKYLLIVITRMQVARGSERDEFLLWCKDICRDSILFTKDKADLLILHGCLEIFHGGKSQIVKQINASLSKAGECESIAWGDYDFSLVIYHDYSTRIRFQPEDFDQSFKVIRCEYYSSISPDFEEALNRVSEGL